MESGPEFKAILEELMCPIHKQHPVAALKDGSIELTCCCDQFKIQCFHLLNKLLSNQNKKS